MKLQVVDYQIRVTHLRLRLPFRYGIITMTQTPYLFLQITLESGGRRITGTSADCLPAKWFTKDPTRDVQEEIDEMLRVIQHAAAAARGIVADTAFGIWREVYARQEAWRTERSLAPLLAHFGTSLVERAVIEAVCRAAQRPFAEMLHHGALGLSLGAIQNELKDSRPEDWLPAAPLPSVVARHTVGLLDSLTETDIAPAERVRDGLPQSLEACITRYGLTHFKLKVSGQTKADMARLRNIADVLQKSCPGGFAFSLDGNEAFKSIEAFRDYWQLLLEEETLREFLKHLLFVEQPLHRDVALSPTVGEALRQWPGAPPMIIDESDATLESAAAALKLGYAGTSHKNCKGVFKGVANRCLLNFHQRNQPSGRFLMSGEDLCGVGPVAVLQDLAVQAALGNESVERNGHHYVAGLSGFPPALQRAMLAAHPDLYAPSTAGWPAIRIHEGRINLASVNRAPLGVAADLDLSGIPAWGEQDMKLGDAVRPGAA